MLLEYVLCSVERRCVASMLAFLLAGHAGNHSAPATARQWLRGCAPVGNASIHTQVVLYSYLFSYLLCRRTASKHAQFLLQAVNRTQPIRTLKSVDNAFWPEYWLSRNKRIVRHTHRRPVGQRCELTTRVSVPSDVHFVRRGDAAFVTCRRLPCNLGADNAPAAIPWQ